MAVIEWNYLEQGTWGPRCGPDGTRTYQITIEAITDTLDSGASVLSHVGFPLQFVSAHPNDSLAICNSIDPDHEEDSYYWKIAYGYSTKVSELAQAALSGGAPTGGGQSSPTHEANPIDRKPKISFTTRMFKQLVFEDIDGGLMKNAAGVSFEAFTLEVPRLVIDVERNLASFNYEFINEFTGAVNSLIFLGFAAERVKCEHLDLKVERDQGVTYFKVHGQFIVAREDDNLRPSTYPDGWWYEWKLNAGFEYLNASGVLTPFLTASGQKPSRPMLLAADGTRLNGTGLLVAGGANPTYYAFRVCPRANLGALGLFT